MNPHSNHLRIESEYKSSISNDNFPISSEVGFQSSSPVYVLITIPRDTHTMPPTHFGIIEGFAIY